MHLTTDCAQPETCNELACTLARIERKIDALGMGELEVMTDQKAFDDALQNLIAAEAARDAAVIASNNAVATALNDLQAKVAAGEQIDLATELAEVAALQQNATNIAQAAAQITQTATMADPGPTTVPGTPAPAPASTDPGSTAPASTDANAGSAPFNPAA